MTVGRQPWMYRDHEDYDPNPIGSITMAKVAVALEEAGKVVLGPMFRVRRYDLVIEDGKGFSRIQCKTARLLNGAVYFPTQSLRAAKKGTEWRRKARDYQGQVEYFGVYCPDNGKTYLVPLAGLPNKRCCSLRVDPPKNNQTKRIRWAKDYELVPAQIDWDQA